MLGVTKSACGLGFRQLLAKIWASGSNKAVGGGYLESLLVGLARLRAKDEDGVVESDQNEAVFDVDDVSDTTDFSVEENTSIESGLSNALH